MDEASAQECHNSTDQASRGVDVVLGELTVKVISSAFILVARALQTKALADAISEACRASASVVESQLLTNALAGALRLAADTVQHEGVMNSLADSLSATAQTLNKDCVHAVVDRGCRAGLAVMQRSLALTSAALENEKLMRTLGCVVLFSESKTVQKLAETGAAVADAAMRSSIVRIGVGGGQRLVGAATSSETVQRSAQNVGGFAARVASSETVQATAGAAGGVLLRAAYSKPVQALSIPVQRVGSRSLEIVTSTAVQNAASRVWSFALSAEQTLQATLSSRQRAQAAPPELVELAQDLSYCTGLRVAAGTLRADLEKHVVLRAALLEEALKRRREVAAERKAHMTQELAWAAERQRLRAWRDEALQRLQDEHARTSACFAGLVAEAAAEAAHGAEGGDASDAAAAESEAASR